MLAYPLDTASLSQGYSIRVIWYPGIRSDIYLVYPRVTEVYIVFTTQ